jgi:DNA-binding CsgD family transcriptional regulator
VRAHKVPVAEILGRDDELVVIDEFLGPTAPLPAALVIEGETGIGKTTLWRHAVSLARDRSSRVLTSSPSEAETSLSFSAIADLLDDEVDRAWSALPPPQARALEVALRRSDPAGQPPDEYAIRAAFLGLLRALAHEGQVVVAVDDVQWLDAPSALVLEFAARRLKRDAVTFVVARRDGDGPPPIGLDRGGPELRVVPLRVGPLSLGAIHRLLHERLGTSIRRPVLRKIYDTSGGNPFFAVELANELARHGLELLADEPLPLPRSLQQLVRSRLSRLAPSTREVLLAVSSLSQPTTRLLDSAFGADQVACALEEATGAGIVEVDRRQVRFAHPLLASACYGEASAEERKAVHRLAAGLVEDSEERAHHLALATDDEDEEVASELERAAVHASDRGAPEAAAELADLATARTAAERRSELVERTLQAGDYRLRSGDAHGARVRFQLALERASSGRQRSEALLRLAQITNDLDEAVDLGLRALDDTADPAQTCRLHQQLAGVYLARGLAREALVHARRSLEAAEQLGDESLLAGALTCASELEYISAGNAEQAVGLLQRALALERRPFAPLRWNPQLSLARWHVYEGRGEEATAGLTALLDGADDRGDDWVRVLLLQELSRVDSNAGRLETADRRLTEAIELAQLAGFGHRTLLVAKAYLDTQLGRVAEARSLASESLELGIAGKSEHVRLDSLAVLGFLELSLGDLSAANARLRTLPAEWLACGTRFPSIFGAWANTIEVLLTVGSRDQAREYLAQYDELAAGYSVPWQLATAARCHGLLAMVDGRSSSAFEWFERALSEHAQAPNRFEEARTLLAYGSALRRAKQRRQGRERLGQAQATFEELGTPLWAKKARTEMSRLGGRSPGSGKLTPSEFQIAELVAAGRSNKEVAAALFLTPKTVETKLSRMYAKLGIHSRGELANRMLSGGKV